MATYQTTLRRYACERLETAILVNGASDLLEIIEGNSEHVQINTINFHFAKYIIHNHPMGSHLPSDGDLKTFKTFHTKKQIMVIFSACGISITYYPPQSKTHETRELDFDRIDVDKPISWYIKAIDMVLNNNQKRLNLVHLYKYLARRN